MTEPLRAADADVPSGAAAPVDAIILAGGTGERLGGVSKADLDLGGRRLLDLVLDAVAPVRRIVVVAPESVAVPAHVLRTLEDPPGGGPVAGIAAGLATLREASIADADVPGAAPGAASSGAADVLILACDMPGAAGVVPSLLRAAEARPGEADGVIAVGTDGRRQNLAVVARAGALARSLADGGDRDRSVRSLLATLALVDCPIADAVLGDVDTWEQHAAWQTRLADPAL